MVIIPKGSANPSARLIKNTKLTGIVMMVIGAVGILLPNVLSFTLNVLVGGLFLLAALALSFNILLSKSTNLTQWFKPIILFILALLVLIHPAIVLSVLGLLIAIYFLFSGLANMVLAFEFLPGKGRWFMWFNGLVSFALGVVVMMDWPFSASWIIGLFIGISFLFDGLSLIGLSKSLDERVNGKVIN